MNIKAIFYVEDKFKITGRGLVAACLRVWDNGNKRTRQPKKGDCGMILRPGETGIVPFELVGIELACAATGILERPGLVLPDHVSVEKGAHILILEDV